MNMDFMPVRSTAREHQGRRLYRNRHDWRLLLGDGGQNFNGYGSSHEYDVTDEPMASLYVGEESGSVRCDNVVSFPRFEPQTRFAIEQSFTV